MESFEKYVGHVFDRRYKIIKIIGIGGMAVVFEAYDTVMKRMVAVKMLKDEIANDTQSVKRFINESKAVSMLEHPNIVNIYDVSVKDDLKYIVMERVEGITLKNYINKKGVLDFKEIVNYSEQILRALEHAHSKGIIHRDIKPQNIMLLKNGKIKVTDFGIAKLPNAETVTMTDKAIGTVFYISPEQASGKKIDPRSDLYSLGVLMYEMSTGTLPFNAESPVSVALMQVSARPMPPREINPMIPQGLEQIILGAMEKSPEKRFQSASQMLKLLTHLKNNPAYVFKTRKKDKTDQKNRQISQDDENDNREDVIIKRRSRSMLPIISGVMSAFLLVLGLSGAYLITKLMNPPVSSEIKTVTVDNLLEHFYSDELKEELEANGFHVLVTYEFSKDYSENTIIDQNPSGGERRKVNINENQLCDLELVVSKGAEMLKLRDYTVTEYRASKLELENMGIHVQVESNFHPTMMSGYIYRTEPEAGTKLVVGDTVTLYVSNGPEIVYTQVPNFKNMTEAEAMDTLIQYKLALGKVTREYDEDIEKGRIISQSINPYTEVPQNETRINFVVSLGKKSEETTVIAESEPETTEIEPTETNENGLPAGI